MGKQDVARYIEVSEKYRKVESELADHAEFVRNAFAFVRDDLIAILGNEYLEIQDGYRTITVSRKHLAWSMSELRSLEGYFGENLASMEIYQGTVVVSLNLGGAE